MNQRRLAVKRSSIADAFHPDEVGWHGVQHHAAVEHPKLVLVVPQRRDVSDRIGAERRAAVLLFVVAGFGVLLTFAGVLLWTTYSYGAFLENLRQQNYNRPQAQYSDIRDLSERP